MLDEVGNIVFLEAFPHPDFAHEFAFFDHPTKYGFHAIAVGNEVEPFEFYGVYFGADVGVFLGYVKCGCLKAGVDHATGEFNEAT